MVWGCMSAAGVGKLHRWYQSLYNTEVESSRTFDQKAWDSFDSWMKKLQQFHRSMLWVLVVFHEVIFYHLYNVNNFVLKKVDEYKKKYNQSEIIDYKKIRAQNQDEIMWSSRGPRRRGQIPDCSRF